VAYFRPDGTLEQTYPIQNGHLQGVLKRYDAHGKLASTEVWANGHRQGVVTGYYPDGRVQFTKTMRDDIIVDTSRTYYPNGEEQQVLVRSATGRLIDFGAWHSNGLKDTRYTRSFILSDTDSVHHGEDYAFEIRLGNRHSNMVTVSLKPVPAGLDSTKGTFAPTRYIIRRPTLGRHVVRGRIYEQWARKGSDTIWTNWYPVEHTFRVIKSSRPPISQ
jgi:hypothetical protein